MSIINPSHQRPLYLLHLIQALHQRHCLFKPNKQSRGGISNRTAHLFTAKFLHRTTRNRPSF